MLEAHAVPATAAPLVQVDGLKMHFPIYSGVLRRHTGDVKAVDGVSLQHQGRGNPWSGRRKRLWQIHRRPGAAAAL